MAKSLGSDNMFSYSDSIVAFLVAVCAMTILNRNVESFMSMDRIMCWDSRYGRFSGHKVLLAGPAGEKVGLIGWTGRASRSGVVLSSSWYMNEMVEVFTVNNDVRFGGSSWRTVANKVV